MKNNDLGRLTIPKNISLKEIQKNVEETFRTMFPSYFSSIPEEIIETAVQDVIDSSVFKDEGYYNGSDISLACQRTILIKIEADI